MLSNPSSPLLANTDMVHSNERTVNRRASHNQAKNQQSVNAKPTKRRTATVGEINTNHWENIREKYLSEGYTPETVVKRFMKGIFELSSVLPKYHMVCDVSQVFNYFGAFPLPEELELKT